ncbi:MAG: molecular chaperone TorD family protein [Candidatus Tectomicrobia bacterium]|uniref:Molecular chaperone TorD family protein n=1 Tax=Tectimicrobiota bacterium TaxID=2528274 RepID=A0A932HWF3_UNCTE|nr:molecular chaperone TorD family protein [Candidatus Tectomicrobia bacterium]
MTGSPAVTAYARSRLYAYLAACFRYPDEAAWRELTGRKSRATLAFACALLGEEAPYQALRLHGGGMRLRGIGSLGALRETYGEVFGHTISKQCPPYETEYTNMHLFQQSDFLADLAGFYRAFGVRVREGTERLDHLAIQLEFLHLAAFKEARALEGGDAEAACVCRDAQVSFIEDHLGRWAGVFAKRLKRWNAEGPYRAAARMLADYIAAEARANAASPAAVADVTRGEFLPMAADEWDASDWQTAGENGPASL